MPRRRRAPGPPTSCRAAGSNRPMVSDTDVVVSSGPVQLGGRLTLPVSARGVVLFAHGSGSSRHSPRHRLVAGILHDTRASERCCSTSSPPRRSARANVFDIGLLAGRLGIDATSAGSPPIPTWRTNPSATSGRAPARAPRSSPPRCSATGSPRWSPRRSAPTSPQPGSPR